MLGNLFIGEIDIESADALTNIYYATANACSKNPAKTPELCSEIKANDGTLEPPTLAGCTFALAKNGPIHFLNDPAAANSKVEQNGSHPNVRCFTTLLRALLVLGLEPAKPSAKKITVVQTGVDKTLVSNAQFLASLQTNNEVFAPSSAGDLVICKYGTAAGDKPDATPANSGGSTIEFEIPLYVPQDSAKQKKVSAGDTASISSQCGSALDTNKADPASITLYKYVREENGIEHHRFVHRSVVEDEKIATFVVRSPEAIVYYLGQIARVSTIQGDAELPTVDGGAIFVVHRGNPENSQVVVRFNGADYFIPNVCGEKDCSRDLNSVENGHSQSLDVLTILNQLWGLQKEETALPVTPAVTVISH